MCNDVITFCKEKLNVYVYPDRAQMGAAAGKAAAAKIRETISAKGEANLIFAAAPSQNEMLDTLVGEDIDWSRVRGFHQDEYIGLDADHPALFGNYLKEQGFNKFLIYAGGNVLVGDHYKNDVYKIGIENPTKSGDIYKIVKSNNMAVVTSGGYERFYEYEGNIYHHIIDPNTLMPPNYMKSVTVITNDSALGDALSTTLFLMSIEEGKEYIKQFNNVEAIWYTNDNTIIKSDGFDKYE